MLWRPASAATSLVLDMFKTWRRPWRPYCDLQRCHGALWDLTTIQRRSAAVCPILQIAARSPSCVTGVLGTVVRNTMWSISFQEIEHDRHNIYVIKTILVPVFFQPSKKQETICYCTWMTGNKVPFIIAVALVKTIIIHKMFLSSIHYHPRVKITELGSVSVWICRLTFIEIPVMNIRRCHDRLIVTLGIPILVRHRLYIESPLFIFQSIA